MKKEKIFSRTIFDSEIIERSINQLIKISNLEDFEKSLKSLIVDFEDENWGHDNLEEFLSDYRKNPKRAYINISNNGYEMRLTCNKFFKSTEISISAPTRKEIESLFNIYEQNAKKCFIDLTEEEKENLKKKEADSESNEPVIFIGHGQSQQWRDLKDHLHEKHSFKVEAYETGARAGHTIRDILEFLLDNSSFAILVLTGEDKVEDGNLRARQNVIHEAGLFQGRLGFNKAIILLEDGTEEFSNIHGIHQIRYSKNNIKETFGEVIATINREFE